MAKHKKNQEDLRVDDFLKQRADKQRTGRRSITLWIDGEIIRACQPHPGTKLREWIELNFWKVNK